MKKAPKKLFSFEHGLNFENLSQLLNDTGIVSKPLSNEQKVCIEYPNISSESTNINIINDKNENLETENTKENKIKNDFTIILSKEKNFTLDVNKLYNKFNKNFIYTEDIFSNSLKIFISIYNNFNEDLFKWNLEDINLFNTTNKIQFFLIKDILNNNINVSEELNNLYKIHLDSYNNELNKKNKKEKINDDFDDFEENKNIEEDDFEENIEIIREKEKNNEDIIYRNIYFLMNLFNLMNYFILKEYNINNLMRNITLFNSYIINDIKILLLIYFNLCIQINLTLSKQTVDNFLGISSPENNISSVSSTLISKSLNFFTNENDKINKNIKSGINTYIPSLYFIDSILLKEDNNNIEKDKIILFNFIIKTHIWTYFVRNRICLKIFVKIFNIEKFGEMKKDLLVIEKLENKDKIYNLINEINYINILNDNIAKECLLLMNADFNIIYKLNLDIIANFLELYFPIFINCNMISFEINNNNKTCIFSDYIEELNIILWLFKFYLKIKKYKFKQHTFTFVSNSFSLAFKKNKEKNLEESYTKEITLFMGINNYKTEELIKYYSDINNFNGVYKLYKKIIKSLNDYKTYDIGIRLFKEDIINSELNYYIAIIVLKLQNYINTHLDIYKKLVLYENKIINPFDCVYLNIKKKLLRLKNNENNIYLREKGENNVLNKISKFDFIGLLKKNGNDSNAEKNSDNFYHFNKKLSEIGFNHEEKSIINRFVNDNKFYFNEFLVYFTSNIITKKKKYTFDPLNILNHFNNNKCFFIVVENSILDIYIYLTDSFDMSIIQSKDGKDQTNFLNNKYLFFNSIISSLKLLKYLCKESFDNKKSHLILRNVNIILNKSTLLQQDLFYDYKSLFSEDNIIYILDEYTKINCIFGRKSITLISNFDKEEEQENKNNNKIYYENYLTAFYSMFLNSYGIIKFINDKKVRKFNKLNIIYNKKIFQIKYGKIQIKKIENQNEEINKENIINEKNENKEEKRIISEYINYNILKANELFHYENSYSLISFIPLKESEINNFSFLFYVFEEIFLSKKDKETQINKQIISKKINKFFNKFKSSEFIPIIFDSNYLFILLDFFEKISNKKENTQNFFKNLILILFNKEEEFKEIMNKITNEKRLFNNFVEKIHIFNYDSNENKYNKNIIGRIFKFNRIKNTMNILYENSEKKEENNGNIIIYKIDEKVINEIIKKNNKFNIGNIIEENSEIKENDKCLIF